jgi:hypothetical protein
LSVKGGISVKLIYLERSGEGQEGGGGGGGDDDDGDDSDRING